MKFRQEMFGEDLASGQDGFEHEAVLGGVIDFDVVVARIDHPQPG